MDGMQGCFDGLKKQVDLIKQVEVDILDQLEEYDRVK
ncbi:hypothetical protein VYU27_010680, partial [Nannochloropsis oceanica]